VHEVVQRADDLGTLAPGAGRVNVYSAVQAASVQYSPFVPFDFNGTAGNGQATLFNVGSLTVGSHRIAARVTYSNGTIAILSGTFNR
jgi:hypothetical protein